jgi:class 3 adenylate cyclase/tetratricopeptide (TPR) repeat protein
LVAVCPACGKELPGEFPFCPFCGAPLAEPPPPPGLEERKVVSVLFCDLVGFTAASERQDPEDVRARLRPYHERLRRELELYGGTVEKFVGDAVMAVFGAPVAHEDDAERAVRAGLTILDAIRELNESDPSLSLQVRVGINTGEAVVALAAQPELGEGFVTGDVVNTAARLQAAAPVNAVVVSEQTYRATDRVFDYEQLESASVKGKADRLALWRPVQARARFGSDVIRTHSAPLVGRDLEKPLLIGTFERSAQQRSCQLVTVVGEPGVGKSRLCAELFGYIEDSPGLVRWRQGRCLPYGEKISFWALGEIVKAECGILESDSPREAAAKLERALPEDDRDRAWLKDRLGALVGVPAEPAPQEESFGAWRRFIESLAAERPTVLVFEDLHWADLALLSFLEHLADWARGVPLLLLCTARPELYEQHPAWAAGLPNATTINLAPLTDEETANLIGTLLQDAVLPAEMLQSLLERAGGNPLYAEEFVRLLADRGLVQDVPESVQALIAARLDTLSPERKSLLQDASVIGKVFWAGALAEMGEHDLGVVEQALHELARKELVRPTRTSSMEGEAEYGFWHLLVRDVCYAQIPRAARAARHQTAAVWLERQAGERAEDLADVLAYHYQTALELTRAAGRPDTERLEEKAIRFLALAAERTLALDFVLAEQDLSKALALAPPGHPERARLLERWAQAAQQQGRLEDARVALEEALALHRERDDQLAAGRVLTALSSVLWRQGDRREEAAVVEAIELLEAQPPGAELVAAYAELAGTHLLHNAFREAVAAADRALTLAAELDLPEQARALGFRGGARSYAGDSAGLEDMRTGLRMAIEQGQGRTAAVLYNNLAENTWMHEGPVAAVAVCREGTDFSDRRGIAELARGITAMGTWFLAESGQAAQALDEAAAVADVLQPGGDITFIVARAVQLRLLAERDLHDHAPEADTLIAAARESGSQQLMAQALAAATRLLLAGGQSDQARVLLVELDQAAGSREDPYYASCLPELVRGALALDDAGLAERLTAGVEPTNQLSRHALASSRAQLVEAASEHDRAARLYADAAEWWRQFGNAPERAYALLGQGRCLLALGRPGAEVPLVEARELFTSMDYKPALAETEALLAQTTAAAS